MQRYKKGERNCKYVWVVFRLCSELHFLLGNVMVEKKSKKSSKKFGDRENVRIFAARLRTTGLKKKVH